MSERILISGETSPWRSQERLICIAIMVGGVVVMWFTRGDSPVGWVFAIAGAFLCVSLEIQGLRTRLKRRWLEIGEHGFVLSRGEDRRWYEDRHVTALACSHHALLTNGNRSGTLRRFQVWLMEEHCPLVIENTLALDALDPLAGFISRLVDGTMERARQTIRDGGTIRGAHWRLDALEFSPRGKSAIPVADLSAVGEYDGRICVWRRGQPKAIFKTRSDSRNSIVLQTLLQTWLNERTPVVVDGSQDPEGLGRLLFQRRVGYIFPGILLIIAAIIGGTGFFFPDPVLFAIPAAVFGGVGFCLLAGGARTFCCHESGALCRGVFTKLALRYADVEALTYAATQRFRNWQYESTTLSLSLIPSPGSGRRAVEFEITQRNLDADLDKLRDFVSVMIAQQLADRLKADGEVPWTDGIKLRSDGFEYRAALVVGRKKPIFIPYAICERFELAKGVFKVFATGDDQPVITEKTSARNFFPGYFLFLEKFGPLPMMAQLHP